MSEGRNETGQLRATVNNQAGLAGAFLEASGFTQAAWKSRSVDDARAAAQALDRVALMLDDGDDPPGRAVLTHLSGLVQKVLAENGAQALGVGKGDE